MNEFAFLIILVFTVAKVCVCVCEPVPALTSVFLCVWALLWNVKNARFVVRSLWNENATPCSYTTQSNCVYFLIVCTRPLAVVWVVQSRSEFRFCSWLKTKIPPVHRMWAESSESSTELFSISFLQLKCPDFTSPVCLFFLFLYTLNCFCFFSLFQDGPGSVLAVASMQHSGRHLLSFSSPTPGAENYIPEGSETLGSRLSEMGDR